MTFRKILVAIVGSLALSTITYAQDSPGLQESTRSGQEILGEGRRHRGMGRHSEVRGMRELNLTVEQRKQQSEILQRHLGSIKAQREELFKLNEKRTAGTFTAEDEARVQTLRQQIRSSKERIRTEMEGILTAEQRTKLEQLKTERKARHEGMREHRREFRERRQMQPQ